MALADVVLLDGTNLAHRAWHASGTNPYQASVTLTAYVRQAVGLHHPTYAAVAFDDARCFRSRLDPSYKASRPPRPEALVDWIAGLRGLDRIAGARVVVSPDHEADDVLATYVVQARRMSESGTCGLLRTVLVTNDQDAYALVSNRVAVGLLANGGGVRYVDKAAVHEHLGVPPHHVIPYKSLVGDRSDGVKGVPGIGPVRGRSLLRDAGTLTGLAALNLAVSYLDREGPFAKGMTTERARALAFAAYEVLVPRRNAPLKHALRDCTLEGPR